MGSQKEVVFKWVWLKLGERPANSFGLLSDFSSKTTLGAKDLVGRGLVPAEGVM